MESKAVSQIIPNRMVASLSSSGAWICLRIIAFALLHLWSNDVLVSLYC